MDKYLVVEGKQYEILNGIVRALALRYELTDDLLDPKSALEAIRKRAPG